jgi:quercetin dioxygenase-like cupin family protein
MADVGTRLVFEDDRTKVWEFTLEAGESIEEHTHEYDYLFYVIEGSTLEVRRQTGVTQATLEAGRVYRRPKGDTHSAKNVGPTRYHEVLVELKDPR